MTAKLFIKNPQKMYWKITSISGKIIYKFNIKIKNKYKHHQEG